MKKIFLILFLLLNTFKCWTVDRTLKERLVIQALLDFSRPDDWRRLELLSHNTGPDGIINCTTTIFFETDPERYIRRFDLKRAQEKSLIADVNMAIIGELMARLPPGTLRIKQE